MYEWYEHRNSYVLVMERPQPALDLFDSLQQQQITEPYARNLFRQVSTNENTKAFDWLKSTWCFFAARYSGHGVSQSRSRAS